MHKQLEIIGNALDSLQSNSTTFSEAYEIWINLVDNEDLRMYKCELQKRFKDAMKPFHALAYMTDPVKMLGGKHLTPEVEENVYQWVRKNYPLFMPGILSFSIKDSDVYPCSMFADEVVRSIHARKWWCIMKQKFESRVPSSEADALIQIAEFLLKLHSCPLSSAALERILSTFGFIWSKLRNKLGTEKVQKLVKIYRFYNHNN